MADETGEIVREHLDYLAVLGRQPWDALVALEGVVLSRDPVTWEFVAAIYREAHRGLPERDATGRAA